MAQTSYEHDLYAWATAQAQALRAKDWAALDLDHLAEEIEDVGKSVRHAVRSYLRVLLIHLLKWTYQPERRSPGWGSTIVRSRHDLAEWLNESPSLRPELPQFVTRAYARARREATYQTRLPETMFPETCPWSLEQLQDVDFWPEG
jgi:Domain of unknown function DUF29